MQTILLPIKPEYSELILAGVKRVEYRKWRPGISLPFRVIVYSSAPIKMLVGEFTVNKIIEGNADDVWRLTREIGGVTRKSFENYFGAPTNKAYAFSISDVNIYSEAKSLSSLGISRAPQRFMYLSRENNGI